MLFRRRSRRAPRVTTSTAWRSPRPWDPELKSRFRACSGPAASIEGAGDRFGVNLRRFRADSPWQDGFEGLDEPRRACRPNLSARLCASLQTDGDRKLFLLDNPVGISKGRKTDAVANVVARGSSRKRAATCPRLPAPRRKLRLNPGPPA